MQKWQYTVQILRANADEEKSYLRQTYNLDDPPQYSPHAMEPTLNRLGEDGWELVHMEPIAGFGKKGDIQFIGGSNPWSNAYFCVFKRPIDAI